MRGYAAIAWTAGCANAGVQAALVSERLREEHGVRMVFEASGLRVWSQGPRPARVRSVAETAVLIGDFVATGALLDVNGRAPRRVARDFCLNGWGRYVCFLADGPGGSWSVFRDPSGALDALAWRRGSLTVVASDLDQVPPFLWPDVMALDWDIIADVLRHPSSASHHVPIRGVHPVAPGDLAQLSAASFTCDAIWRPAQAARSDAPPRDELTSRLQETLTDTVRAMIVDRGRLLMEVSGGLDSAVVAATLRRAQGPQGAACTALNYFGDRAEGDERPWAKAVCAQLRLPLLARPKTAGLIEVGDLTEIARGARPALSALDAARDRDTAEIARALEVDAIVTGAGGDAVFFQAPTPKVVSDYLLAHGAGATFDPFVQDVARWLRCSIWSVLHQARQTRGRAGPARIALSRFLGPRAGSTADAAVHPWLKDLGDLPPAKRLQVQALTVAQLDFGRTRRAAMTDVLHPLLMQPVVELCLTVPTWIHVAGGVDRSLARRAFADWLPESVVQRCGKGSLTSLYARQVAASEATLRPFLLDGVLVSCGVLDGAAVADALEPDRLLWGAEGTVLLNAAAVEAWVRYWQGRIPDAPDAGRGR